MVRPGIYRRCAPLEVTAHHLHGEPIPALEGVGRPFTPFAVGDTWGGRGIPRGSGAGDRSRTRGPGLKWWRSSTSVVISWSASPPRARFGTTGLRPVQGLHHQHREFVLTPDAHGGELVEFFVEAAANPIPPWLLADWPLLLPDYSGPTALRASRRPSWRSSTGRSRDSGSTCRSCSSWPRWTPSDPRRSACALDKARAIIDPENVVRLGTPGPRRARSAPRPAHVLGQRRGRGRSCPHRLVPGCGRYARPGANAPGPSPTSCACSSATPSTTSCAARPCSTSG